MLRRIRSRMTYANVVASLALFIALGGVSYAAVKLPKNSVGVTQIKKSAVTGAKVKDGSLTGADVKNRSLTADDFAGAVQGPAGPQGVQGLKGDVGPAGAATKSIARKRVIATNGIDTTAARTAAPAVELFQQGALTVYAKCFTNTTTNVTSYGVYIKTAQDGAIFDSRDSSADGGPAGTDFLNVATDETFAELDSDNATANNSRMGSADDSDFTAFAPDGTTLRGWTGAAVKNGTLGSNGVYGEGNVCLFTGAIFGN